MVYGLMLGFGPLAYGLIKQGRKARAWWSQWRQDDGAHVMALWLAPNLALWAPLVRAPGHTFSFLPALMLLAAGSLVMLSRDVAGRLSVPDSRLTGLLVSLSLMVNVVFFLSAPPYLLGVRRIITTTPSWPTIRSHDRRIAEQTAYIQQNFDPATTVLVASGLDFRYPAYYLRDYKTLNQKSELEHPAPVGSRFLVFIGDSQPHGRDHVQSKILPSGDALLYLHLDEIGKTFIP
jgi:hypothetical protein